MSDKSFPELSVESKLLYERLKKLEIGEMVTYEELTAIIGRDVREDGQGNLQTARRRLLVDDQIHLGVVRGEGIKRVDDETVVVSDRAMKHIANTARRRRRELHAVDYDALKKDLQIKHNVELTQTGTVMYFVKAKAAKVIADSMQKVGVTGELPIGKTLEFFATTK